MSDNRIEVFDIHKGLLAYLVILGHCMIFGSVTSQQLIEKQSYILRFIYAFHMPLFMMISGCFTGLSMRNGKRKLIEKRGLMIWTLFLFAVFSVMGEILLRRENVDILGSFTYKFFTNYWFCWAVFWLTIIIIIVEHFCRRYRWLVYGIIMIAGLFLKDGYNFADYKFMFPYMVAGVEISKLSIEKIKTYLDNQKIIILFDIIAVIIVCVGYPLECYIHESGIYIGSNGLRQVEIDIYRWLIGFIVSYAVFATISFFYYKYEKWSIWKIFSSLGKKSLSIYILHVYPLHYIVAKMAAHFEIEYSFIVAVIESLGLLVFCIMIIYILKKLNLYSYIFIKNIDWKRI